MTNTARSPHWTDDYRRAVCMFIRDNPSLNGDDLTTCWNTVYGGGADRFCASLAQFEREGLIEYVPADGTPHVGGLLGDPRPHIWQLADDGRMLLQGSPS